jgi:FAD/FMN-containing dehydrogenase
VLPGTRFVTVGGAIANDIHGKNHGRGGSFGCHVRAFELLRSTGERVLCRPGDPLFAATIGGLGLTGLITWAEIQLRPVRGPFIVRESVPFPNLDAFFEIDAASANYEYTVAWIDGLSPRTRGIYYRGDHSERPGTAPRLRKPVEVPFDFPEFALGPWSVGIFNALTAAKAKLSRGKGEIAYPNFFFPLDGIGSWNRIYGARGFLQFQCVVPDAEGARSVLSRIRASRQASFLAVLKTFGELPSPGMLSFPRKGITLALDFAHQGAPTVQLYSELEDVVREHRGALYPAKDALMSAEAFEESFPRLKEFLPHVDPAFSSSFWRRVTRA